MIHSGLQRSIFWHIQCKMNNMLYAYIYVVLNGEKQKKHQTIYLQATTNKLPNNGITLFHY
jgi:hypothetical protein